MTPDHIHDALTLLPSDLIEAVDRKRQSPPKIFPYKQFAAMAACFVLVLGCSSYALTHLGQAKNAATEAAAPEAPMLEAAPSLTDDSTPREEAAPKEEAAPEENRNDTNAAAGSSNHSGTTATLHYGQHCYTLRGDSIRTLNDMLSNLSYNPEPCCDSREEATICFGTGSYAINLTEFFVRHDGGQAALTKEQAAQIRQIIEETIPNLDALSYSTHQVITPSLRGFHSDHTTTLITSRAELEAYWNTFASLYDFSGMKSICTIYGYDDIWFEKHDLLLNVVFSKVGVTHSVTAITDAGGNYGWDWEILISVLGTYYPDNENTAYHLITRLEKGVISPDSAIIAVFDTIDTEEP